MRTLSQLLPGLPLPTGKTPSQQMRRLNEGCSVFRGTQLALIRSSFLHSSAVCLGQPHRSTWLRLHPQLHPHLACVGPFRGRGWWEALRPLGIDQWESEWLLGLMGKGLVVISQSFG